MKANLIARSMFALGAMSMASAASLANDFPTSERVLYVQECMRANPGPQFEMISKCSCALDSLAADGYGLADGAQRDVLIEADLGGERGGSVRDVPSYEPLIKRYRELQAKAQKGCFITPAPR
jgi:hypothetical protein